jgi:hypothetical protein
MGNHERLMKDTRDKTTKCNVRSWIKFWISEMKLLYSVSENLNKECMLNSSGLMLHFQNLAMRLSNSKKITLEVQLIFSTYSQMFH